MNPSGTAAPPRPLDPGGPPAARAAGGGSPARLRRAGRRSLRAGGWGRTAVMAVLTAVVLVPVAVVPWNLVHPGDGFGGGASWGSALQQAARQVVGAFTGTDLPTWLWHSLLVTGATVLVSMLVAVPAGYTLARGRGRGVSGYALALFLVQCFPVVMLVIPMFILLARYGLVDHLSGLTLVYIAVAVPVATWMVSTSLAEVPHTLEQAAWLDGCSPFGAFVRIVVPAAAPALLGAAMYTFVITWNDYLIAAVFIHGAERLVLPLAQTGPGGGPVTAIVMMVPPLVGYAIGHARFSVGGVAGALVE